MSKFYLRIKPSSFVKLQRFFCGTYRDQLQLLAYFMLFSVLFDSEDRGDMFHRNVC
jgi:hypothetical protein